MESYIRQYPNVLDRELCQTLIKKFEENLKTQFSSERVEKIMKICEDQNDLESLNVTDFMEILIKE